MAAGSKVLMIIVLFSVALIYVYVILCEIVDIKEKIRRGEEQEISPTMDILIMTVAIGLALIFRKDIIGFLEAAIQLLK